MKLPLSVLLRLLALLPVTYLQAKAAMHYDWGDLEVGEIDENTSFSEDGLKIYFKQRANSRLKQPLECGPEYQYAYTENKKYVACCLPGQSLKGSRDTEFKCCGAGHDVAGDKEVGFECCPTGQKWDGKKCKSCEPEPPVCTGGKVPKDGMCVCPSDTDPKDDTCVPKCSNGKVLVDGKCVCPTGQVEDATGSCKPTGGPAKCSSGIQAGKCYTWRFPNGELFGSHAHGWYTASKESRYQQFGKFKLCKDEECTPGDINPGDGFSAMDIHGDANSGARPNHWIDGRINGDHVRKTPDYKQSGKFVLTKWPCGKYCLGGLENGFGPTCPSDLPAGTFVTSDKQSCIPIEVTEVPCDIKDPANNCIWHNGDQCCNKVDCSGSLAAK